MTAQPWIAGNAYQIVYSDTVPFSNIIYEYNSTTSYVCKAVTGSGSAESVWQIKRILETGSSTNIGFPYGDARFIYQASLMLTYPYS